MNCQILIGDEISENAPEFFKRFSQEEKGNLGGECDSSMETSGVLFRSGGSDLEISTEKTAFEFPTLSMGEQLEYSDLISKWSALRGNPQHYGIFRQHRWSYRKNRLIVNCDYQMEIKKRGNTQEVYIGFEKRRRHS